MAESTVWRVMHPDGSRTVVGGGCSEKDNVACA
jgi:hypothetical protein